MDSEAITLPFLPSDSGGGLRMAGPSVSLREESTMYDIGEKPGKGAYKCTSCNSWTVTLDDTSDKLPPCGTCGPGQKVKYRKV